MSGEIPVRTATQAIADLCRERRHNTDPVNPKVAILCESCRAIQSRLERLAAKTYKPPSTTSVHFVVDPVSGRIGAKMDEAEAAQAAMDIKGVVVSWPVSGDYREET